MVFHVKEKQVKKSKKSRILDLLRKMENILPYALVGGGMVSALYKPELLNEVGALLVSYVLARTAYNELAEAGVDKEKAKLAKKITENEEKILEKMGITKDELEDIMRKILEEKS